MYLKKFHLQNYSYKMLTLIALLIPLIIILYLKFKKKNDEFWKHIMEIPGPQSIPILGTEYELQTPGSAFVRERQRMKEFYPIYKIWTFDCPFVYIIDPEDIELILHSNIHNDKASIYKMFRDWMGLGLVTSTGSKWHNRRKLLTPAFHFTILQKFVPIMNKECEELVEVLRKLSDQPYIEIIKHLTNFTFNSIVETSLGVTFCEALNFTEYQKAVKDYGNCFSHRLVTPWLHIPLIYKLSNTEKKTKKILKILHEFSYNTIKEKQKQKRTINENGNMTKNKRLALLDLLLQAKDDGYIDDNGIREELDTFIAAGHETTAVTLSNLLMLLANEPDIQEEIYEEIVTVTAASNNPSYTEIIELKLMERCIKESLRICPSVSIIGRRAGEDIKTKSGYIIPKGCNVNICIYDLHRNPEIWENPKKFDPDRFLPDNISKRHPYAYIPFSAGGRNCIGQKYAMLEIKVGLYGIIKNFKLEPVDKLGDVHYKADLVVSPLREIKVKFIPRI